VEGGLQEEEVIKKTKNKTEKQRKNLKNKFIPNIT
jgi:hypothetical protein